MRMPRDSRIAAREAAAMPLPREETTPPVTKMNLVIRSWATVFAFYSALRVHVQSERPFFGQRRDSDKLSLSTSPALVGSDEGATSFPGLVLSDVSSRRGSEKLRSRRQLVPSAPLTGDEVVLNYGNARPPEWAFRP